jgi:hypothetical protein
MEDDPVLFVQRADEVTHLRAENSFHRPPIRRDHMDFDAPRAQGGSDLESDEASAQHNREARGLGSLNNGSTVSERAKNTYVRLIGAWDGQTDRFRASRKQQAIVRDPAAVGEPDLAGTRVDGNDARLETQVNAVLGIEVIRTQRNPFLRR